MYEIAEFIHYSTVASIISVTAIGVGIGQGITGSKAIEAINKQPSAHGEIIRATILSIALIETAAVMAIFVSLLLILGTRQAIISPNAGYAELGIAFALCLPGFTLGLVSSLPAQAGIMAIARQPFFAQKIVRFILLTLSLIQTPIIFGLIVALFIRGQAASVTTMRESLRLIASGLCVGLGTTGPALGLALFGKTACTGIGLNRAAYNNILSFTFISQAIIETPIIFSLIVSIALLFLIPSMSNENILDGIRLFAAGLCTGIGTIGPGISSGRTAMAAVKQIAINPENYTTLSRVSMFAQGLIETCAIYAVLISFFLLFFV